MTSVAVVRIYAMYAMRPSAANNRLIITMSRSVYESGARGATEQRQDLLNTTVCDAAIDVIVCLAS